MDALAVQAPAVSVRAGDIVFTQRPDNTIGRARVRNVVQRKHGTTILRYADIDIQDRECTAPTVAHLLHSTPVVIEVHDPSDVVRSASGWIMLGCDLRNEQ